MRLYNYMGNKQNNAMCLELDFYTHVWFSYEYPVAFRTPETGLVVKNVAYTRTGARHLKEICKHEKYTECGELEFDTRFNAMMEKFQSENPKTSA